MAENVEKRDAMPAPRLDLSIGTLDETNRTFAVVASTDAVDSHGHVVEQDWDLRRYQANPVVLYGHRHNELPIGSASDVRVEAGSLHATIRLVDGKANPLAEQVFELVRQGALRAVSVGFRPKRTRKEKRDDAEVTVLSGNELLEISVVPVPSNAETLARSARALGLSTGMTAEHIGLALEELAVAGAGLMKATGAPSLRSALERATAALAPASGPAPWEARTADRPNDTAAKVAGWVDAEIRERSLAPAERETLMRVAWMCGRAALEDLAAQLPAVPAFTAPRIRPVPSPDGVPVGEAEARAVGFKSLREYHETRLEQRRRGIR